jgi:levansucrase
VPATPWTREHLAALVDDPATYTPIFDDAGVARMLPDVDFWDLWPVRDPDGSIANVGGREVWAGLSAPAVGHPGARHDMARIRLVMRQEDGWADLGPLFPDGASPGSREWAGSLAFDPGTERLSAYYTAAGSRGEPSPTFWQRIFTATGTLRSTSTGLAAAGWGDHRELIVADGRRYQPAMQDTGEPGFIKAFRDPFFFRDRPSGQPFLLFTGSMADSRTDFNGCIGLARGGGDEWVVLDPLIVADGVNNELERPHLVFWDGRYYLFFSTQQHTFHPDVSGPTGLYGFVGDDLLGPYQPLNGSGRVLRNPPEEPFQAYSWLVLNDLHTVGFVDFFALHGRHPDDLDKDGAAAVRRHFGGTMTPALRLSLDGRRAAVGPAT